MQNLTGNFFRQTYVGFVEKTILSRLLVKTLKLFIPFVSLCFALIILLMINYKNNKSFEDYNTFVSTKTMLFEYGHHPYSLKKLL